MASVLPKILIWFLIITCVSRYKGTKILSNIAYSSFILETFKYKEKIPLNESYASPKTSIVMVQAMSIFLNKYVAMYVYNASMVSSYVVVLTKITFRSILFL